MALSTCPKCNSHSFEMVEQEIKGSKFKLMFVQCVMCGAVVGVTDFWNIGALVRKLAKALRIDLDKNY